MRAIRIDDLNRLGVRPGKAIPFIVLPDHRPRDDAIQRLRAATLEHNAARTDSQLELQV